MGCSFSASFSHDLMPFSLHLLLLQIPNVLSREVSRLQARRHSFHRPYLLTRDLGLRSGLGLKLFTGLVSRVRVWVWVRLRVRVWVYGYGYGYGKDKD